MDLKPENILIGDDFKLKLCDFGFLEPVANQGKLTKNVGTDGYKAPEIYALDSPESSQTDYDGEKADMFSLGVILYVMTFGKPPLTMATPDNVYYRLFYRTTANHFFRIHPATKAMYLKGQIPLDLMDLLLTLMDPNPAMRPKSIHEIRMSSYLQKDVLTLEQTENEMKSSFEKIKAA